ncbi:transcriptional regulator LysR family [Vibrio astriarenae]|nr:transcriptional regulator LysR family [Vibrio sp. C7]
MPKLLEAYCKLNPMTRFMIQPTPVSSLKNEVLADSIDLAFILEKPFHRQGLTVHTYQAEEIVLVCSPTHPLTSKHNLSVHDLVNEHLLLTEKGCCYRHQFELHLIEAGILNNSNVSEFISIETIKECAKLGIGIAALSVASVKKELEDEELVVLTPKGMTLSSNIHCVYNAKQEHAPQVEKLIEFCLSYQFN